MRNLKINKKRKESELELNCDFYPEHVLRSVTKDFGEIFNVNIERKYEKFDVKLKLKVKKIEIEKATYDFLNYLLAKVKNDRIGV